MTLNNKVISFIVCSNGYGHLKRVIAVVTNILKLSDKIDVVVFCSGKNMKIAQEEINFFGLDARCTYCTDLSYNELDWISKDGVSFTKFINWQTELSSHPILITSDLVISDNHITPITVFENVKLMGSFIWSDVVNYSNNDVEKIKEIEFLFLQKRKPEMYCLNSFAMPALIKNTIAVQLPWFCEPFEINEKPKESGILISGGGTALINDHLSKVALNLIKLGFQENIYLDSKLYELIGGVADRRIRKFSFSNLDFFNLKAIVCRPGIGILTDCVKYGLPPIVINDGFNEEINHNASTVNKLEIGRSFSMSEYSIHQLSNEIILILNDRAELSRFRENIKEQKTGGAAKAAQLIVDSIKY